MLLLTVAEVDLVIEVLLGSDDYRLWKTLVVARNLDLLTILVGLLHRIGRRREVREFASQLALQLGCNLVCTTSDYIDALVNIACLAVEICELTSNGVVRNVLEKDKVFEG